MENTNETKKPTIVDSGIDKDVLEILAQDHILKSIESEEQMKRVILNCFCEFFSQLKEFRRELNDLHTTISICGADKVTEYFTQLQNNVKTEETRLNVQEKIKKSHQKKSKSVKSTEKDDKILKMEKKA